MSSVYNEEYFFSQEAKEKFISREASLRGEIFWPNRHYYNDEEFCELYRQSLNLINENEYLRKVLILNTSPDVYEEIKEKISSFFGKNNNIGISILEYYAQILDADEGHRLAWQANLAMLLHDRYDIKDFEIRNQAATDILNSIFDRKWEPLGSKKDNCKIKEKKNMGNNSYDFKKSECDNVKKNTDYYGDKSISPVPTVEKVAPISRSLTNLRMQIESLNVKICELGKELIPILDGREDDPQNNTVSESCGYSDVAGFIDACTSNLAAMEYKVKILISKLEI